MDGRIQPSYQLDLDGKAVQKTLWEIYENVAAKR